MHKKNIIILLVVCVLIVSLLFISFNNKKSANKNEKTDNHESLNVNNKKDNNDKKAINYNIEVDELKLSESLKSNINKNYTYQITHYNDNKYNGVINKPVDVGLGQTKALFTYDVNTNTFKQKQTNFKGSVTSFIEKDNNYYYVEINTITIDKREYYSWSLIKNNKELSDRKVLLKGNCSLFTLFPELIVDEENQDLYFFSSIDRVDESNNLLSQKIYIYHFNKENFELLKELNYKEQNEYIGSIWSTKLVNKKIFFVMKTKDKGSKIYLYDTENNKIETLYEDSKNIFDFEILDNYLIITLLDESENTLIKVYKDEEKLIEEKLNGISNIYKISNNKLLIESSSKYKIYNTKYNEITDIELPKDLDLYRYSIKSYKEDTLIIMKDFDDKLIKIAEK